MLRTFFVVVVLAGWLVTAVAHIFGSQDQSLISFDSKSLYNVRSFVTLKCCFVLVEMEVKLSEIIYATFLTLIFCTKYASIFSWKSGDINVSSALDLISGSVIRKGSIWGT